MSWTEQQIDLYQKIEFDKVIQRTAGYCFGALGSAAIEALPLHFKLEEVKRLLNETFEMLQIRASDRSFPLAVYEDVREDLKHLEIEGFVLTEDRFMKVANILRSIQRILNFFKEEEVVELYPNLAAIVAGVAFDPSLLAAIDKVFNEEGQIKPDASSDLRKISNLINARQRELDKAFRDMVQRYRSQGFLTDNVESFRNGRRVLSVPAEHKRKIRGIIHDESTTGRTAFIEPEAVINLNNDIFDLQTDRKREIYRILRDLSGQIRPFLEFIEVYQSLLVRYDVIQAKAKLGAELRGIVPKLTPGPHLGVEMGYHPLLKLKNNALGRETVPFDLTLYGKNRILVLSGPNAGGKSITMKAVGLLQLMLQSGMLVPCDEISEFGIFKTFFADIGDQQSLEDDLSTYSSRLKQMRQFIEEADEHSLVLIDEFGSGTDPKMGGAIAEAILHELNRLEVYGVITTHYGNLKIYAFKALGLVNGSMHFDKDTLNPTYELKVGRPGSSFAFEIATKSGLSKKVLSYARSNTGKTATAVDDLLIELQREKQEVEEQLSDLSNKEKKLQRLISTYENMHRDLDFRRKRLKLDLKEAELQKVAQQNKELDQLIRELREKKDVKQAKTLTVKIKEDREKLVEQVEELTEEIYYKKDAPAAVIEGEIEEGSYVKMRRGGATGQVMELNKNTAIVQMGSMRMTVKKRDLQLTGEPLDVQKDRSVKANTVDKASTFDRKIDIRGMRLEDAQQIVEAFLDQALVNNSTNLEIVHGKGTGVLRKMVKSKIREYRGINKHYHPAPEFGGDGVTFVEL